MAVHERARGDTGVVHGQLDPQTLTNIERIFFYEHQTALEANNDNKGGPATRPDSACFDSWALPEYLRK